MNNYRDINDYELIYLVEEKNDYALEILFDKYQPIIHNMARMYHRSLKKYGVEFDDIYQEACLAFEKAVRYYQADNQTLFYTFVCISIRSKLANYARGMTAQKNLAFSGALSLSTPINEEGLFVEDCIENKKSLQPEDESEGAYLRNLLKNFTWELNLIQGQIFELKYHGFDNKEIASLMELTPKDVSNHIYRIRQRLKKFLNH